MNRLILFLICIIIGIHTLNAQDLIVTSTSDSINCKITLKTFNYLRFRFNDQGEIRLVSIPMEEVNSYQYDFYHGTDIPKIRKVRNHDYPHWRLDFNMGLSKHIGKIIDGLTEAQRQYVKDITTGKNISADVTYYYYESWGCGLKYLRYYSSTDVYNYNLGTQNSELSIQFVGPVIGARILNNSHKNAFNINLGVGYIDYNLNSPNRSAKGNTVAIINDLGYDIIISDNIWIGLQLSYLMGNLNEFYSYSDGIKYTTELPKGNYESLHRLDLSVGIRYNF